MTTEHSPTVRKLRLGIELRGLRQRAGRTMLEAADQVARTDSTISRLETGQVAVSHRVLEKLLDLYEAAPEERDSLRVLAGQARRRGWWHSYAEAIPDAFEVFLGLETEATDHWIYEPEAVPALLQTDGYARALLHAEADPPPDATVEALCALRARRQGVLADERPPALRAIVNEAVLHRRVGGAAVQGDQLRHLVTLSESGSADLRVLPFGAGAHPAMRTGGFTLLSVPLGGEHRYDIVYVEHRSGGRHLDRPDELREHRAVWDRLHAIALDPAASRTLIARTARDPAAR